MRIILMGPPGAGKGTQASVISRHLGVPHISSGEIFRLNMAANTPLGVAARQFIERGDYVPDDITNGMIRERLVEPDASEGFLLDGYPRTLDQIHRLDEMLAEAGQSIDAVIEMTVDVDIVVKRLAARAALEGRSDDDDEIIRNRLDVYRDQTEPLTAVYAERGLLRRVDAIGQVSEVTQRILDALER
jgi:adenylate kinase